ncbi:MAG: hypothetical protein ACRC1K_16310, partial [Planctomycetia bacterium]
HRRQQVEIPYSPDVPLQWPEVDLVRTHVFVPTLLRFAPAGPLVVDATWPAPAAAVQELLGIDAVAKGGLQCTYFGTIEHKGAKLAQIGIDGEVTGTAADGRSTTEVVGALYLDAGDGRLHSLRAKATRRMLGPDDAPLARLVVDYQLLVQFRAADPDLDDATAESIPEEPDPRSTVLEAPLPPLGLRILHPRRWLLARAEGNAAQLEHQESALVVHVEAEGKTPTLEQFRAEVKEYLAQRKMTADEIPGAGERTTAGGSTANFRFKATVNGKPTILDYWVVRDGEYGGTAAARLTEADAAVLLPDVARIVDDLRFSAPVAPPDPPPAAPERVKPEAKS